MADAGGASEHQRGREDIRSTESKANRQLDALALSLESNVVCAAVTIIKDKLYIAANEIYEGHPKEKTRRFVDNVLSFFKDVATYGRTQNASAILTDIVSLRANVSATVARAIVPYILEGNGSVNAALVLRREKVSELPADKVGAAIVWAGVLFNDLKKQVSFLKERTFDALRFAEVLQEKPIIVDSGGANVHAEMKLLGEIIRQVAAENLQKGSKLYIGISKLCCLKCACVIMAAQTILGKKGIELGYPGRHDVEKTWKWGSPTDFPEDTFEDSDLKSFSPLVVNIVQEARKIYQQKIKTPEKPGIKQERDLSDSSGDELDPVITYLQYITQAVELLKVQQKAVGDSEWLQQELSMFNLGLRLCRLESFTKLLYLDGPKTQEICLASFNTIMSNLFEREATSEERRQVFEFLKTLRFSGKFVSKFFQNFELPELRSASVPTELLCQPEEARSASSPHALAATDGSRLHAVERTYHASGNTDSSSFADGAPLLPLPSMRPEKQAGDLYGATPSPDMVATDLGGGGSALQTAQFGAADSDKAPTSSRPAKKARIDDTPGGAGGHP